MYLHRCDLFAPFDYDYRFERIDRIDKVDGFERIDRIDKVDAVEKSEKLMNPIQSNRMTLSRKMNSKSLLSPTSLFKLVVASYPLIKIL